MSLKGQQIRAAIQRLTVQVPPQYRGLVSSALLLTPDLSLETMVADFLYSLTEAGYFDDSQFAAHE